MSDAITILRARLWSAAKQNRYTVVLAAHAVNADLPCHDEKQLTEMIAYLSRNVHHADAPGYKRRAEVGHELTIPYTVQDWWHRYERAYYHHIERTCPNVIPSGFYCPPKKPVVSKSGGLRSMMKEFLYWSGHMGEAVNTMGKPVKKMIPKYSLLSGKIEMIEGGIDWHKSGVTRGSADLPAQVKNPKYPFAIPVKWEIKIGKDIQSIPQQQYEARVTDAGGIYFLVKTPEQFFNQFDYVMSL